MSNTQLEPMGFDDFRKMLVDKGYQYGFDAADNAYMGYKLALELVEHQKLVIDDIQTIAQMHARHGTTTPSTGNCIRVKSSKPGATGVYDLFPAPSPHHNDYSTALPQLPEREDEQYPHMAVGSVRLYLVYKYSFYNREKDLVRHEAAQAAAKEAAERKGKQFNPTPFKEKGPSRGTWTWLYTECNGMKLAE
jgi:hypothetical protein